MEEPKKEFFEYKGRLVYGVKPTKYQKKIEKYKAYQKEYYRKNKEKIKKRYHETKFSKKYYYKYSIRKHCVCGGTYLDPINTERHMNSILHTKYQNKIDEINKKPKFILFDDIW